MSMFLLAIDMVNATSVHILFLHVPFYMFKKGHLN